MGGRKSAGGRIEIKNDCPMIIWDFTNAEVYETFHSLYFCVSAKKKKNFFLNLLH